MKFPPPASALMLFVLLGACNQVASTVALPITTVGAPGKSSTSAPAKPGGSTPTPAPVVSQPTSPITQPETPQQPAVPVKVPDSAVSTTPIQATPIQATDVYLNHFCLLSDHSNLCSRTTMHPDWPGHSLKLEPMNGSGKTLTGTLVIEYDASKIEPAVDGNLRHSVKHTTTAFEKSPGKLTIRNFVVQPGKDYQYLWNRIKPNASGTVKGKATLSWLQDNQTKYAIGCYEFQIGSEGGDDNILGLEKGKFNGYGGMDCGNPSIPE
jgi:hypothetical protein